MIRIDEFRKKMNGIFRKCGSARKLMGGLFRRWRREKKLLYGYTWRLRSVGRGVTSNKAAQYLTEHQRGLVFITGSGRSGTQLVWELLKKTGRVTVHHEPNFSEDVATMDLLRRDSKKAKKYWRYFRNREVYKRWIQDPENLYAEVNGTIRYQLPAIRELYPQAYSILLVRDGRDVIRSIMGLPQFYNRASRGAFALGPLSGDKYLARWGNMSRFEKVCWSWMETNQFLMQWIPENRIIKLETIVSDWSYFDQFLSRELKISMGYEQWRSVVMRLSRNATKSKDSRGLYRFSAWEGWTEWEKSKFKEICGSTMEKLGYTI